MGGSCTGGCDCGIGTRIFSWQCAHACLTPVTDSMLSDDMNYVKKSCYSGSDPQTRVSCAKGHPMTATSVLVNKHEEVMGLCGGLSLQKSRIMPYSIIPCHQHAEVDLTADSSREFNLGWNCSWCFLANAYGEPLCSLDMALTYHSRWKQTTNLLHLPQKDAPQLPDGPLLRHLRHGATLDHKKYKYRLPQVDTMMQLMFEFASFLFGDQALDPVSGKLYPVYSGMPYRDALACALESLCHAAVPGFDKLLNFQEPRTFRFFLRDAFHTRPWYDQTEFPDPTPWIPKGCPTGKRRCRDCGNKELGTKRFLSGGKKGNPAAAIQAERELVETDGWDDMSEFEDEDMDDMSEFEDEDMDDMSEFILLALRREDQGVKDEDMA